MRNEISENDKNNNSAFTELVLQVEKEKKKVRIVSLVSIFVLFVALIIFLLFGPFKIPIFSHLGDRILGKEEVLIEEKETDDSVGEENIVEDSEEKEVIEVPIVPSQPTNSPTVKAPTTPKVVTPTEKTYLCTDGKVALLQSTVTQKKYEKNEEMSVLNNLYTLLFVPRYNECVNRPEGCSNEDVQTILYEYNNSPTVKPHIDKVTLLSSEIEKTQEELTVCLSDR